MQPGQQKITQFDEVNSTQAGDIIPIVRGGQNKRISVENFTGVLPEGWVTPAEAWTFSSFGNGIGVITIPEGAISRYPAGTRVWFKQGTPTTTNRYGVVVSSTTTTLTVVMIAGTVLSNLTIQQPATSSEVAPRTLENIDWTRSGGWEELGRSCLSSAGTVISVTPITAKRYLRILTTGNANGGTLQIGIRFNGDSSLIYNFGYLNGTGASGAIGSQSSMAITALMVSAGTWDIVADIVNTIGLNKQILADASFDITSIGNGYAPGFQKTFGKWVNTATPITRVDLIVYSGTGNFAAGSELVVLGHD